MAAKAEGNSRKAAPRRAAKTAPAVPLPQSILSGDASQHANLPTPPKLKSSKVKKDNTSNMEESDDEKEDENINYLSKVLNPHPQHGALPDWVTKDELQR